MRIKSVAIGKLSVNISTIIALRSLSRDAAVRMFLNSSGTEQRSNFKKKGTDCLCLVSKFSSSIDRSIDLCVYPKIFLVCRYLDQFGKTKVHTAICPFYGLLNPPAPCPCPLRQAWGSLDALVGRLRAAFEENGGKPEANPFGARAVRLYLREVRDLQSKARGISYEKKRKRPQAPHGAPRSS